MINITSPLSKKVLVVCMLSGLLLSQMQLDPVDGTSVAASKEAMGTQLIYGQYQGEQGDWMYIQADQMEWNDQSQSVRSGTGNPIWKVNRSLTMAEAVSEEAFAPISDKLQTWDSGLSQWQEVPFTVDRGIIKVGSLKLFTIPGWVEDSPERSTRVGVMKYPGQSGETIYRINYMTSPPGAASVHDFSTYLLAIEKKGKVQVVQAPKEGRILRSRIIMHWGKGQYLLFGDMPGPDFSAAARVTSDGKFTDLNDYIGVKMKIKDWPYGQILGIRNGRILFSVAPSLKTQNWSDLRETGIYELDANLSIHNAPETLKNLRVIDASFNPILGSDGTLYHMGGNSEILFDLTHRRQLDLFQG